MEKWNNSKTEDLLKVILALKTTQEAKYFFRDLLTEKELIELGNRFLAARMLYDKVSYVRIEKKTNLSSRTVARISKWLNSGKGGYKLVLDRMANHHLDSSLAKKGLS